MIFKKLELIEANVLHLSHTKAEAKLEKNIADITHQIKHI